MFFQKTTQNTAKPKSVGLMLQLHTKIETAENNQHISKKYHRIIEQNYML